jgi:hypothetical protein
MYDRRGTAANWVFAREVRRERELRDAAARAKLVARERRGLGCEVVFLAHGRAVFEVVAAVGPEPTLQDVVCVERAGGPAHHALVAVTGEHAFAKLVASQQFEFDGAHDMPFSELVGVIGFEPTVSCSRSRRDNQVSLHPDGPWRPKPLSPPIFATEGPASRHAVAFWYLRPGHQEEAFGVLFDAVGAGAVRSPDFGDRLPVELQVRER